VQSPWSAERPSWAGTSSTKSHSASTTATAGQKWREARNLRVR